MDFVVGSNYAGKLITLSFSLETVGEIGDFIYEHDGEETCYFITFNDGSYFSVTQGVGAGSVFSYITFYNENTQNETVLFKARQSRNTEGSGYTTEIEENLTEITLPNTLGVVTNIMDYSSLLTQYMTWEEDPVVVEIPKDIRFKDTNEWVSLSRYKNIKTENAFSVVKQGETIKFLDDGSVWERIFWHDITSDKTFFANEIEAKNCDLSNRYSNLINIESYRRNNGEFEFLLNYPSLNSTQYNRWAQRKNPLITKSNVLQEQSTMEYKKIHIDWDNQWYYGMGESSYPTWTLLDCCAGSMNWFGSIGQYQIYQNVGFPCPDGSNQTSVELWMRIDNGTNRLIIKDDNVINIFNVEQYKNFVTAVNAAEDEFEGKTVNLYSHLDLSNETLESITIESFAGTLNGNFFTITVPDTCPYLIDTNSGKILSLITKNSNTGFTGETELFAGICKVNMGGTISNCCSSVNATIDGECSCGGICAVNFNGTIEKSMFIGSIKANTGFIGGIVRQSSGIISGCIVGNYDATFIGFTRSNFKRKIYWRNCL